MEDYSPETNHDLIVRSYSTTSFTRNVPLSQAEADAAPAESFECANLLRRRGLRH